MRPSLVALGAAVAGGLGRATRQAMAAVALGGLAAGAGLGVRAAEAERSCG